MSEHFYPWNYWKVNSLLILSNPSKHCIMKKILLGIFVSLPFWSISQSLTLSNPHTDVDGDLHTSRITVNNVSGNDLDIKVRREVLNLDPNHITYFCWGNCYGPGTEVSPDVRKITAGGFDDSGFYGDLATGGNSGFSRVKYCFYDSRNEADSVCHVFTYDLSSGIRTNRYSNFELVNLSPNPMKSNAVIDYNLNGMKYSQAKLVVRSLTGAVIFDKTLTSPQGQINWNADNLNNGIYMYSIVVDGKPVVAKKVNVLN